MSSDVVPTIVQLDFNIWASSCTISGATSRTTLHLHFQKPTRCRRHVDISKKRPSDVVPTIVKLDSNALVTSRTNSGATSRDNGAPTSLKTSFRRRSDDSSTRFQCFSNVKYQQWSDVARQQWTYISKKRPSDVVPTIVQLDSNAIATSNTNSGETSRDNVAPTFPKTNIMPTSCQHKVSNQKPM